MKKSVFIGSLLFIISCNQKEKVAEITTDNKKTEVLSKELKLETFAFPPEVEGCSCYFAKNKADFEEEKYIYIDDYGNNAFLKINGKLLKIEMKEGDFDPDDFSKSIKNDSISVEIKGKKIKEMDEVMMFKGTMSVENKKGEKTTTPIYGECGC